MQKKKHHYVPASYLRGFCDRDGFVNGIRKTEPVTFIRSNPLEIGFRKYYYSQPAPGGGQDNNALEGALSTIEDSWPEIAESLNSARSANYLLPSLMTFMGLQRVRVPAFRDAIEQSMEKHAWQNFEMLKNAGELPPPPPDFPDIADQVQITIDPHQSIHAMLLARRLGPTFDSFGYVVLHNLTDIEFLTSDNPVAYFLSSKSDKNIVPYSWSSSHARELVFPVSPQTMIYGSSQDRERYRSRGLKHIQTRDEARVRRLNRITVRFAYEVVFGKSYIPKSLVERYATQSPVLDPSFAGFHPDDMELPPYIFGRRRRLPKWKGTRSA